jgi:arylsulfatase A-like enzyme
MPGHRQPNVVFVLTDDQGYGDLGCHGNTVLRTPNIDRLYAEGVRFTDYHTGTTCAPTRAGLLTGHYCNSAGVWHTIGGHSLLRADEWTLADAFRSAGYRTGHFGKWHLGDTPPFRPHERGFEETVYHAGGGIGNTGDAWGNDYFDDTYFVNGTPRAFEGYCTDVFFREGRRFIERHAAEPFFCYIATNAPHTPLNVEPRYVAPYRAVTPHEERARFYGMIGNIDDNVGALRARLEELGLADDTILIFMTDNGTASGVDLDAKEFPREGRGSYNAGMRGVKGSPYEGGHRVPFLLWYPAGGAVGGRDIDALASYVDFMPTVLGLCGVRVPEGRLFHGRSLVPLLRGEDAGFRERTIVSDTQRVARPVKWRKSAVMRERWRLINGRELYDLGTDPGQRLDVAANHPEVVALLRREYEAWWEAVSGQFDRDAPIAVGEGGEPVKLTTHDIRNEACDTVWNQRQVREGLAVSGYWEIDVRHAGRYRLELRRWPEETARAVTAGIEGDDVLWRRDCVPAADAPHYTGGVALGIGWAQISIGGQTYEQEVGAAAAAAELDVSLAAGQQRLYAAFHDERERTIAPYYVYVRRRLVSA